MYGYLKVKVVGGGGGSCRCEMRVEESHQNRSGTLHGGLTCTLVDAVSTWALMGTDEPVAGVSVDLSVSCVHLLLVLVFFTFSNKINVKKVLVKMCTL